MQSALRLTTKVQPGGKVQFEDGQLQAGESVEVIVLMPSPAPVHRRSVVDILADAPGHLAFQTADEVAVYLREERDAWER
jgi:hypothetical protein